MSRPELHVGEVSVGETNPAFEEVCPYPGLEEKLPEGGPFIEVALLSQTDLESLCKKKGVHHLYFRLYSCQSGSSGPEIARGAVRAMTSGAPSSRTATDQYRYAVYLPIAVSQLVELGSKSEGVDVRQELRRAQDSGFCLSLGGASMTGSEIASSSVRLPIAMEEEGLTVAQLP